MYMGRMTDDMTLAELVKSARIYKNDRIEALMRGMDVRYDAREKVMSDIYAMYDDFELDEMDEDELKQVLIDTVENAAQSEMMGSY